MTTNTELNEIFKKQKTFYNDVDEQSKIYKFNQLF